jgi:hypothetical protein
VQDLEELVSRITSQYILSGSEVLKVVSHAESLLLMATKPDEPKMSQKMSEQKIMKVRRDQYLPRPKAIRSD